jgi:hypothetical protein
LQGLQGFYGVVFRGKIRRKYEQVEVSAFNLAFTLIKLMKQYPDELG